MARKRHPVYKKGDRNALCPHYNDCLDEAVQKYWEFWNCGKCQHKMSRDPDLDMMHTMNDSIVFYDLPYNFDKEYR